jgi:uncharacterized protein YkwD
VIAPYVAALLLALHNGARAEAHVPPLRFDRVLARAAARKARDVSRCGFTHTACGRRWSFYLPRRYWLGENLAEGFDAPSSAFNAFMHSQGHRANVLRRGFRRVGFAELGDVLVVEFSS